MGTACGIGNYITLRAGHWLIEGDWLNAEDAEEEKEGVALWRVPCGWRSHPGLEYRWDLPH